MVEVFNQGDFSSYRIEDSRYSGVLTESRSFSAGTRRPIVRVESSDIIRERLTYPIERPLVPGYYVASVDSAGKVTYVSLREWLK